MGISSTLDQVNIELVRAELKPACLILLHGDLRACQEPPVTLASLGNTGGMTSDRWFLSTLGIPLNLVCAQTTSPIKTGGIPMFEIDIQGQTLLYHNSSEKSRKGDYIIAKKDESIDKFLAAQTNYEKGIALGYPQDACRTCQEFFERKQSRGRYVRNAIILAIENNIEIPDWLAYISHVPSELDLVNARISRSSEEQGKAYQECIRKRNPGLAERLECEFKGTCQRNHAESSKNSA